jgi:hypothetical protein
MSHQFFDALALVLGEVMAVYLGSDGHSVVKVLDGTKLPSDVIISPQT